MKSFQKITAAVLVMICGVFFITNYCLLRIKQEDAREHRVQLERAARDISEGEDPGKVIEQYPLLIGITKQESAQMEDTLEGESGGVSETDFFEGENWDYAIRKINGSYYRFDYQQKGFVISRREILLVNGGLGLMALLVIAVFFYIRVRLLAPFYRLRELPFELSKGNLNLPLK